MSINTHSPRCVFNLLFSKVHSSDSWNKCLQGLFSVLVVLLWTQASLCLPKTLTTVVINTSDKSSQSISISKPTNGYQVLEGVMCWGCITDRGGSLRPAKGSCPPGECGWAQLPWIDSQGCKSQPQGLQKLQVWERNVLFVLMNQVSYCWALVGFLCFVLFWVFFCWVVVLWFPRL